MPHAGHHWAPHLPTDTSLPIASTIRQIDALQLLRAVAVILVIWCHAGQVLDFTSSHALPDLGVFGIDLFFVISGFILSLTVLKERKTPGLLAVREFMKRRFLRIYPIYWLICIATLTRLAFSHHLFDHNWAPAFFLFPELHYPGQTLILGCSWTMNFEIFFYFLLGLMLLKTIKWAVQLLIILLITATAVGSIVGIRHPVAIVIANPILLEFVFGAIIALLYARLRRRRVAGIAAAAIGVMATLYFAAHNYPYIASGLQMVMVDDGAFARVATWGVCAALIVGGTVFWSPSMKSAPGRLFVLLGNASYSIYLTSAFFLEYSFRLFFRFDNPPILSVWNKLFFECSMLLSLLLGGFAVYTFVERPLLRMLQSRFLKDVPSRSFRPITGYPSVSSQS
jgi:exopolysaccharide production protein ExoZ